MEVAVAGSSRTTAAIAARLKASSWTGAPSDLLVVVFSIRGHERLPDDLGPLLSGQTGRRACFVICGDFSRPPGADHPASQGLCEWLGPESPSPIAWVDTPVSRLDSVMSSIFRDLGRGTVGATIWPPRLPRLSSDEACERIVAKLALDSVDLSDGAGYERSLLGYLEPTALAHILKKIARSSHVMRLNAGYMPNVRIRITLPRDLVVFRAANLRGSSGAFANLPPLEELVLLGAGDTTISVPSEVAHGLKRVVVDKNRLAMLPRWIGHTHQLEILSFLRNDVPLLPTWLRSLRNLSSLTIGANPIATLPGWLPDMRSLRHVSLWNMTLDKESAAVVSRLLDAGVAVRRGKTSFGGGAAHLPADDSTPFPALARF
jgi:hypothetical protein